jgi:hypothetical protein
MRAAPAKEIYCRYQRKVAARPILTQALTSAVSSPAGQTALPTTDKTRSFYLEPAMSLRSKLSIRKDSKTMTLREQVAWHSMEEVNHPSRSGLTAQGNADLTQLSLVLLQQSGINSCRSESNCRPRTGRSLPAWLLTRGRSPRSTWLSFFRVWQ